MSKYYCIFNHYNPSQTVNAYVFLILDYFSSIGCETIVVSNSKIEGIDLKERINRRPERWLEHKNKGDDFDSWQYALEKAFIPDDTEYLFLLNDSIFGPLTPLDPIVHKMLSNESIDFWGLTDSYLGGWHLQTYFLCCKRKVFSSEAFQLFFKQGIGPQDANEENNNRAVLWTRTLIDAGFKGKAYVDYNLLLRHNHEFSTFRDPVLYYPERLIRHFQFPFIKKEFIFNNPENIEIPEGILGMLNKHTTYPVEFILESIINRYAVETVSEHRHGPFIDVVCHLFYLHSAYDFLSELSHLKKYNCRFFFSLSDSLYADPYFIKVLTASFKNCILIRVSNTGKDLGGKLAVIDLILQLNAKSDYTILLHDKHSPHTSLGKIWKKKLFRIIEPEQIENVIRIFASGKRVGIVSAGEFIKNEYDSSTNEFDCTCDQILKRLISQFKLSNTNFDFVGGTMFWVRSEILEKFFSLHSPLDIRATFEKGNVLDNNQGTETHAWERMLSWIAIDQGYTLTGINE